MQANRVVLGAVVVLAVGLGAFWAGMSMGQEKKMNTRVYELRTYTTLPGRLPALNKRFADHTLKLFEKHGMKNEMYFVPGERAVSQQGKTETTPVENTLIYLVSHDSREAADKSWKAFGADPEWKTAQKASEADGKIVEKVERVWMTLTDYSPKR